MQGLSPWVGSTLVLLKHVWQCPAGTPSAFSISDSGEGRVHPQQYERMCWISCPAYTAKRTHKPWGNRCTLLGPIFSLWVRVLFHPVLDCVVFFLGISYTKMKWAKVFVPLFLVAGIMMIFTIFHGVGILL